MPLGVAGWDASSDSGGLDGALSTNAEGSDPTVLLRVFR
jgi:hypothetical protein